MKLVWFALQSVRARPHSWIVGVLAAGLAALCLLGLSLLESIHGGTQRSLIESGAGHLQVYHSASPEPPRVTMMAFGGPPELPALPDYPATEALLRQVEGVQEVVPLEVGLATLFRGNYLDEQLASLRAAVREPPSPERQARLERLTADLRRILQRVAADANRRAEAFAQDSMALEDQRALEEATSARFWERFAQEPQPALEFLENHVARQAGEGESIFLDYLGSDLPLFAKAFPRFELVSGELPPPGQRGILLGQGAYEQSFKLPIAFRLDEVRRGRERGSTLAEDEGLRSQLERNLTELAPLVARLDVERATALRATLTRLLGHPGELEPLLSEFLTLEDGNFEERYQLFYRELAPHLPLYHVRPGDTLLLKKGEEFGGGIPVKVWGTFRFRGLGGDFSQVNSTNLVDLVTARHLADRQTREQQEEARKLLDSFGMSGKAGEELSPEAFGSLTIVDAETKSVGQAPVLARAEGPSPTFTEEELKTGSILQAAVVLKPGVEPEATAARIRQLGVERKLPLAVVGWEEAGGMVSGVVKLLQGLMLVLGGLLGFFLVLVSAGTLLLLARERVGEVGTLRAVGMQRQEVFLTLLFEGGVLGVLGGGLGLVLGALLLKFAAGDGLTVGDENLQFFLGGPVVHLGLEAGHVLGVGLGVLAVVMGAALVPAWRGSSVLPIEAMRRRED